MAEPGLILSLMAAIFFVLIGLEELPLSFNIRRVTRQVRRRARRRGEAPLQALDRLVMHTHRSVLVLVGFALASALLLAYLRLTAPAGSALHPAFEAFAATSILGLLFLAYAFGAWAPRLMARVAREFQGETAGSNAAAPFDAEKAQNGHHS